MKIMKKLKKITIDSVQDNKNPKFLKTNLVKATREDGYELFWEYIESHDSVHILVDNTETKELMFVEQVRIPALVNNTDTDGVCLECCAGLVDKEMLTIQIAKEEISEEMGYDVPVKDVKFIRQYLSSVGTQATNVYCFTAKVTEDMKISEGGGLDSEDIRIVRIPYADVHNLILGSDKFEFTFTDSTTLFLCSNWLLKNLSRI
jgi:UDP-sugar diphosphatase